MVLTKAELIEMLRHETRILSHLIGKIDPAHRDYRPTPKQRSATELVKYLGMMGPAIVEAGKTGVFDEAGWVAAEEKAKAESFAEAAATIAAQGDRYAALLADVSDEDLRREVAVFGEKMTLGRFLVFWVLGGAAAYRTQLFLYLKACGREELGTLNLWSGMDAPVAV